MANKQVNQLTNLSTMDDSDLILVYDVDGAGNEKSKNMTYAQFHTQISGTVGGGGGGGDVTKVGTPVNNELGVWTGDGTLEGESELTYDGSTLIVGGDIRLSESSPVLDIRDSNAGTVAAVSADITFTNAGSVAAAQLDYGSSNLRLQNIAGQIELSPASSSGPETVRITQGGLVMLERADHSATPAATLGELWVKNDAPNALIFTDDAGTDHDLTAGGGISNVLEDTTPELGGDLDVGNFDIKRGTAFLDLRSLQRSELVSAGTYGSTAGVDLNLKGGSGTTVGQIGLFGGAASAGDGGNITIQGGSSYSGDNAGIINIRPGGGTGAGYVMIQSSPGQVHATDVRWGEASISGSNYVGLTTPTSITTSRSWTLPVDDPSTADGQFLTTDSSGVLSFAGMTDLGEFTVANLPSASSNADSWALATNASGGRTIVRSDGTNWKVVVVEGATVST